MPLLAARQCPRCALRFGSSSELDQHVRLDHAPKATRPEAAADVPESAALTHADSVPETNRFVVRAIMAAAVIAFVAVISWHVAALLSVAFVAAIAIHAAARADSKNRS